MIKRNAWKVIFIALVVLIYLGYMQITARERYLNVNTKSSKAHPLNQEIHFHTDQIVHIFKKNHIQMTQEKNNSSEYELDGVHPTIYELNQNKKYRVFIYVFNSLKERLQESQKIEESFNEPFSKGTTHNQSPAYVYDHYSSWNVLFLVPIPTNITNAEYKKFPKLDSVVFKDMNDGQIRIYKGKTSNWNATFTYNYFQHWYKDQSGVVVTDSEGKGTFDITYSGSQQVLKNVTVGYDLPSSSATLNESSVKKSETLQLNYSPIQTILYPSDKPKMTFQWDGKEESVVLQPQH
jgi:hypothetical protein